MSGRNLQFSTSLLTDYQGKGNLFLGGFFLLIYLPPLAAADHEARGVAESHRVVLHCPPLVVGLVLVIYVIRCETIIPVVVPTPPPPPLISGNNNPLACHDGQTVIEDCCPCPSVWMMQW